MNIIDTEIKRPTNEEIAKRAYELFVQRGRTPGNADADWIQAETELLKASTGKATERKSAPVKTAKRSSASRLKKIVLG